MRGLFLDKQCRLSIRQLEEAPAQLPALTHPPYLRTGVDLKRQLIVYEQVPGIAHALTAAAAKQRTLAVTVSVDAGVIG
jgi:hypothetical protein